VDLRGTGVDVVIVCPGFIRSASPDPDEAGKPFILDLEDGARRVLAGIERRRRVVHFPWQLSYPMRYVVRHLPARTYDWLVGGRR
jgi:short-subunit dehydrogenase